MYKSTGENWVLRLADQAHIPFHPENADYQEFLSWVAAGGTPEEADLIVVVPESVTPWQIRKALNASGLRTAVETAVANSGDQTLKDGWEFATEFRRDDPFVAAMGAALGKTSTEMDELFVLAGSL